MMRARIVKLSWAGSRVATIADELGCSAKTVRWWLHRFNRLGLEELEDRPVSGRPRRITESERSRIIALVKQPPPTVGSHHACSPRTVRSAASKAGSRMSTSP